MPYTVRGFCKGNPRKLVRQCEGDMRIGRRQEFLGRSCQPFLPSPGLALGAGAIAARLKNEVLVGTVITLLEACAQSGGSACADVPERLALVGRKRIAPPRQELLLVLAKDIGDFQPRFHTLSAVILGAIDGLQLQRVERTADRLQSLEGHAQIAGRGPDIGMPEQHLDGAEIGAGVEHVRGACVSEQMRINGTSDTGPFSGIAAQVRIVPWVEGLGRPLFWRETANRSAGASESRRATVPATPATERCRAELRPCPGAHA